MYCDQCRGPLEHFEGEAYCPDCTRFEGVTQFDQATNEALALLALDQADDPARAGTANSRPSD
jgi:uncharacterized Zn finger protein (UPF0148 family)